MRAHAVKEPIKAKKGMLKLKSAQSNIIAVAAVPAPAETPIIPGSAKGLRITACNKEPAVARQAPTTIATMTRGKRKCNKIFLTVTDPLPNKARTISSKLYPADPILNESRASRARIPKRMPASSCSPGKGRALHHFPNFSVKISHK